MKKSLHIILFFAVLIPFTSCNSLDDISQFSYNLENTISIEPVSTTGSTVAITSETTPTNIATTLTNYNTQESLVDQIFLNNCILQINSPSDGNFSFLSDISIYIQVTGLPDKIIAWSATIPNENNLELITTEEDLKDYLFHDDYTLYIIAHNDEAITDTYEVIIQTNFDINAQFIGG